VGLLSLLYTIGTLAMFGVCTLARAATPDATRLARAAAWVLLFTGVSRLVSLTVGPPWSMVHYPAEDLLLLLMARDWWRVRGEPWAAVLIACFLTQLSLHALYWFDPASSLRRYIIANNAIFIIELLTLTTAGGGHAFGWVLHRLRMLRHRASGRVVGPTVAQ